MKRVHIWSRLANVGTIAYNPGAGPLQKSLLLTPGAFSHGSLSQGEGWDCHSFIKGQQLVAYSFLARVTLPSAVVPLGVKGVLATDLEPFKKGSPVSPTVL